MPPVHFLPLCALLFMLLLMQIAGIRGLQDGQPPLPLPKIVSVYAEGNNTSKSVWKMNIKWEDGLTISKNPDKVSYELEIFYSEQNRLVHNETIEVKRGLMGTHEWSWTSPIPLQCTTHSVRIRSRLHNRTSDWSTPQHLTGKDVDQFPESVYPVDPVVLVGDPIVFCCILPSGANEIFSDHRFKIQISNRTYITEEIREPGPPNASGINIPCGNFDSLGSVLYTGYKPDVQNLTCETREPRVVECSWSFGPKTNSWEKAKQINYTINGRTCLLQHNLPRCALDEDINMGERVWTLIAKNVLGKTIISDKADPKHRVLLKAPVSVSATRICARSATLELNWNSTWEYHFFPMICQVKVNGHIVDNGQETLNGTGLVLTNLQPFTKYTTRVRCGSYEHFYKWGDWSPDTTFFTKEDIPEAVDVWMHDFKGQTFVMWKVPTTNQSHGIITNYVLDLGTSPKVKKNHISSSSKQICHELPNTENTGRDQVISVSAENSIGVSPPSAIVIPNKHFDRNIKTSFIIGNDGVFDLVWEPSPLSSCGYVVDWFRTYQSQQCDIEWMKIPPGVSHATIRSDFIEGVRYNISVYACTHGAPQLLQRSQGYIKELKPSKCEGLKAEKRHSRIELSWKKVPEENQTSFIKTYDVSYKASGEDTEKNKTCELSSTGPKHECIYENLNPARYTFSVITLAFTKKGDPCETTLTLEEETEVLIISVVKALTATVCVLTIITILCYKKRQWLKSTLYPDIPKPKLTEAGFMLGVPQCHLIDKVLFAESEVQMMRNLEPYPQVTQKLKDDKILDAVISPDPEPVEEQEYCKNACEPLLSSPISIDSSYTAVPWSGIPNPTYNLTLSLPVEAELVSGYIPQKQNDQIQPCDVKPVTVDFSYKPQAAVNEISINNNSFPLNSTLTVSSDYLLHST